MWKVEYVKSVHDCESISVFSISLMIAALELCGLDEAISATMFLNAFCLVRSFFSLCSPFKNVQFS